MELIFNGQLDSQIGKYGDGKEVSGVVECVLRPGGS